MRDERGQLAGYRADLGALAVGGGAPVSVQTMANADPHDAAALVEQVRSCAALGCDVFRLTVPDVEAAKVLGEVKKSSPIPLVADIHFDYLCALAAIEAGADKIYLFTIFHLFFTFVPRPIPKEHKHPQIFPHPLAKFRVL